MDRATHLSEDKAPSKTSRLPPKQGVKGLSALANMSTKNDSFSNLIPPSTEF
jgi:hypothetical protein